MNTVVITGAGGYVGGLLARSYAPEGGAGAVRCLVRTEQAAAPLRAAGSDVVVGDLRDTSLADRLITAGALVIHAAARLGATPTAEMMAVNVDATARLVRAALGARARRFVFVSSIEAYGDFNGRTLDETQPFVPNANAYAESKALGERAVRSLHEDAGSSAFTILRPGMIYGPHSPYWTHRYLSMARRGRIPVLGHGGRIFPVYEDDLITAVHLAASRDEAAGQTFNLVHDEGLTWWDWARAHHRLAGHGRPRRQSPALLRVRSRLRQASGRPGRARQLEVQLRTGVIPHQKASDLLGWSPSSFAEVMRARSHQIAALS